MHLHTIKQTHSVPAKSPADAMLFFENKFVLEEKNLQPLPIQITAFLAKCRSVLVTDIELQYFLQP